MSRQVFTADPDFGSRLRKLRVERRLSLRRLGVLIHCSHGYLWELEVGKKRPSLKVARLLDEALAANGRLKAMVREVSADSGELSASRYTDGDALLPGLEFAPDWRHGVDVAAELWQGDMERRDVLRGIGFSAAVFFTPAMRWLTSPLDEHPAGDGQRLVGEPEIDMVRQITGVYRTLDNQYGGGHVRESVVRFLHCEATELLRGRYDTHTGEALFSAVAETTQLVGWASYDAGMHGLAQRYMVQALRLAAAAGDRALGAEVLAAMSHQAAYMGAPPDAIDLARAAGRAADEAGVTAIQAEAAVLEAQGHAAGRDEGACAKALDRAEHLLDRADRTSDPQWIRYFDEAYLAAKFGHCFTALDRGDLAQRFAVRSLDMDGEHYCRGRQFNLSLLAVAYAQSNEPEQAAVIGVEAVEVAEGLRSVRARDYLTDLARRLARHTGLPAVQAFTERARPVLQSV